MKKQKVIPSPTEKQFNVLNGAFKYFNRLLFGNKLLDMMKNKTLEALSSFKLEFE